MKLKPELHKKTIIFANTAEAFKDQLMQAGETKEGRKRINHELALSQRAFFWEGDHKVVVTPYGIPESLFEHNKRILNLRDVMNLFPKDSNIDLSRTIINDPDLLLRLIRLISENPDTKITSYSTTSSLLGLLAKLEQRDTKFIFSEKMTNPAVSGYLDSKAGFRKMVGRLSTKYPEVKIPEGFICTNERQAVDRALFFLHQRRSCVIKANLGESGWGTMILKQDLFKNEDEVIQYVKEQFLKDVIWNNVVFVVEEYIEPDVGVVGGSPSTEVYVSESKFRITYSCEQVVNSRGEFLGVGVGKGAVPPILREKLEKATNVIGQRYWELGYRGFFDVDFVISAEGVLLAVETNTRRTGGTHVYDLGRMVFGEDMTTWGYLLSEDSFEYGDSNLETEEILNRGKELLYPIDNERRGIVITLVNTTDPVLGYIVIGNNKDDTIKLQAQFKKLWGK